MRKHPSGTTFLSYSSADRKVAERLRDELQRQGVTLFWSDDSEASIAKWRSIIEEAIHSADAILVLVGPRGEPDEWQRFTWMAALETVWKDPAKRIIPVLLKDAEIPTFIYSASPDAELQVVRIEDPRHVEKAARILVARLRPEARRAEESRRNGDGCALVDLNPMSTDSGKPRGAVESERAKRLSEIRRYAESLKARG